METGTLQPGEKRTINVKDIAFELENSTPVRYAYNQTTKILALESEDEFKFYRVELDKKVTVQF